ncbi:MAG TPA: Nif3-like dinuclear metal center hexameric protein [Bryobacteraceae bacterium]|nr:Nif3-like dinuclear metal center hexameric protein [Bryobacteraceae bacterium]
MPLKLSGIAIAFATCLLSQESAAPTAQQIIDQIKAKTGVSWREDTVDTIKAGDPQTRVTGIATTMMATFDVLRRAAAEGKNLVITHEPTFYSHQDKTDALEKEKDAVWADKDKFIRDHKMVVWRFHDHWHMRRPDGILEGVLQSLGWEKLYDSEARLVRVPETTVDKLATHVQKRLGAKVLRVVGDREMKVTTVAMQPGAGGPAGHLRALRRPEVEVLLIGEVPEWETIEYVSDAVAQGKRKALLLVGHIPSEQPGMENCATWLRTFIKDVPVGFVATVEPFWTPR